MLGQFFQLHALLNKKNTSVELMNKQRNERANKPANEQAEGRTDEWAK